MPAATVRAEGEWLTDEDDAADSSKGVSVYYLWIERTQTPIYKATAKLYG
jgi:hypothetical protein